MIDLPPTGLLQLTDCTPSLPAGEMSGSPEFWFSAPGAGAKAHMDAHCQVTG